MRIAALGIAAGTGIAALAAVPPASDGTEAFPLVRLRDTVVSVVASPSSGASAPRRVSAPAANRPSVVPSRLGGGAARSPQLPGAAAGPDGPSVSAGRTVLARLALSRALPPASPRAVRPSPSVSLRLPASRAPVDGGRILPRLGVLSRETAGRIAATLVYKAMQEGSENPTDPVWRPFLAELVAHPPYDVDAGAVYQLLLAGFEGVDDDARMRLAEAWAARHDGGRYAGDIAFASLRAVFDAGDYRAVRRRAEAVAAAHPGFAVRAMLLSVLADGYEREYERAKATLETLKAEHADSPEYPEILYMEAWLALETFREGEAKAILRRILRDHPSSAAARRAAQILEAL